MRDSTLFSLLTILMLLLSFNTSPQLSDDGLSFDLQPFSSTAADKANFRYKIIFKPIIVVPDLWIFQTCRNLAEGSRSPQAQPACNLNPAFLGQKIPVGAIVRPKYIGFVTVVRLFGTQQGPPHLISAETQKPHNPWEKRRSWDGNCKCDVVAECDVQSS